MLMNIEASTFKPIICLEYGLDGFWGMFRRNGGFLKEGILPWGEDWRCWIQRWHLILKIHNFRPTAP